MDCATPIMTVMDPRGLHGRSVAYWRLQPDQVPQTRVTRHAFDPAGREIASWDPRLWAGIVAGKTLKPNVTTVRTLSGTALSTNSVDAGWHATLLGQAGEALSAWDSRGSQRHTEYDPLQRPVVISEWMADESPRVVERFTYGDASVGFSSHNQCGRVVRHDDPAGTRRLVDYALNGLPLAEERQFLNNLDRPDWPLDDQLRDELLEDGKGFVTAQVYTAAGEMQSQTDAMGNFRLFAYMLSGELKEARLQLARKGVQPCLLVSAIHYNAFGQVESESAGNGVKTTANYADDDGRLIRLRAEIPGGKVLQDLSYSYDPVGNILSIEDRSQLIRYSRNQRIEPINRYRYDSLYQVVEARGREVVRPSYGLALSLLQPTPLDPNQLRQYTQAFAYDRAGNLLTRQHSGAPTFSMATSQTSNRSMAQHEDGTLPDENEIANGFDVSGNQRELQRGQTMSWDVRNQLSQVTLVKRDDGPDDQERYIYDRPGHRLRKVRLTQTGSRTLRAEVRYLPGLEIHRDAVSGEKHHVISVDAGRNRVRVLHWETQPPEGLGNDQPRYSLSDHLGSSTLELDKNAGLLSQEGYYPFGGTAWWAGSSATVARYKTIRYSGKERDATGLYYYGYRYYAPWLQRWMNPDPAGADYGLNVYAMVENRPTTLVDGDGRAPRSFRVSDLQKRFEQQDEISPHFQRFIRDNFKSDSSDNLHEITSTYIEQVGGENYESWFENEFHEEVWIFKENYKTKPPQRGSQKPKEPESFYASDVARYQYEQVAHRLDFFGVLPSVIKRENVMNYAALANTWNLASDAQRRMTTFFTQTPNGKSTLRIMEDFGLEAIDVERVKNESGTFDFLVHVQPRQNASLAQQGEGMEKRAPSRELDHLPDDSRFFGAEPLKGSFRRGSIDIERGRYYWHL
ncbi:hypothetical protein PS723_01369 [Pseudomonas fluorescens]|uniref:Toxin n=2 Tax=Pseudomonas fluorescens TaxID=294 RepID=A0A5E7B0C4_PSEFL|nr:hypothetical protein PS723_01369 [Pseudomonas fluorescens]